MPDSREEIERRMDELAREYGRIRCGDPQRAEIANELSALWLMLDRLAATVQQAVVRERPSPNSPPPIQLRDHPLMSRGGVPNWPPQWTSTRNDRNDKPFGEAGILMDAVMPKLYKDKCFLIIEHEGKNYMGCLLFDDPAFCLTIYRLLKCNIGRLIKEIGDLDLSHTL